MPKIPYVHTHLTLLDGSKLSLDDPDPDLITLSSVANALSKLCRFGGQIAHFYSVAQHCVEGARLLKSDPAIRYQFLMHDATEAFCADLPRPIKERCENYQKIEEAIFNAVQIAFNLPPEFAQAVHDMDNIMVMWEARDLCRHDTWKNWHPDLVSQIPHKRLIPWSPEESRAEFLNEFFSLQLGR